MENWPFHDEQSGYKIQEQLFYGFSDSGSMYVHDHPTREAAIEAIKKEYPEVPDDQIGTKPEQLGEYCPVVISGREYVDELKKREILDELGHWEYQE